MDSELLSLMDQKRGAKNRSQFIREAIAKMLGLPSEMTNAPDRVKAHQVHRLNVHLNDEVSTEPTPPPQPVVYPKPKLKRSKKKP
jgi:hypothetical protein